MLRVALVLLVSLALPSCDDRPAAGCDGCSEGTLTFRFDPPLTGSYVFTARCGERELKIVCDAPETDAGADGVRSEDVSFAECSPSKAFAFYDNCGDADELFGDASVMFEIEVVEDGRPAWTTTAHSTRTRTDDNCGTSTGSHETVVSR